MNFKNFLHDSVNSKLWVHLQMNNFQEDNQVGILLDLYLMIVFEKNISFQ